MMPARRRRPVKPATMSIYNHLSLRGILKKPEQFVVVFYLFIKTEEKLTWDISWGRCI